MDEMQTQPEKKPSRYGKRPKWQWAVIYLVAAIIVYGLIYYIFIRNTGDSTGGGFSY